jgi:hypothetical protein
MKKSFPVVLALSTVMIAGGCKREADKHPVTSETPSGTSTSPPAAAVNERDQALVRVVNAVPGTPSLDVVADKGPVATSVQYASVTPYKQVPASADKFEMKVAGAEGTILAENREPIMSGKQYTLIAVPGKEHEKADLQVVTDDIQTPDNGKARVRVIHAASDVEAVDVFAKGDKDAIFDGVDFKETTSYKEIDPTVTTLELKSDDGKRVVARPTVTIEPGKSYTIVVTGHSHGTPALKALVIEDRLMAPTPTE